MTEEAPPKNPLGEQSIEEAATAAIHDLQLDVEVKEVSAEGDDWCVHFSAEYNQFCDTFRDQFDKENSFELIREKIKRHILKHQQNKIRAGVRIRRGKTERRAEPPSLFETAVKAVGDIAGQTAGIAGEIINQASRLPETALTVADAAAKAASTIVEPAGSPPVRGFEQPLARVTIEKSARKTTRKRSSSVSKASSKKTSAKKTPTTKKAAAKKTASKKASSKKQQRPAAKSAAKSASRPAKARGGGKKSGKRK